MKKAQRVLILFLTLILAFALSGCFNSSSKPQEGAAGNGNAGTVTSGGSDSSNADAVTSGGSDSSSNTPNVQLVSIGDTITTDSLELTIRNAGFSRKVEPPNPSSYYTYYDAENGKVYFAIRVEVKNLGKNDLDCDEVFSATADYNDGYTYTGFTTVEEDNGGNFTYANITSIAPLETRGLQYLIDCPEEVESSTAPFFVILRIQSNDYKLAVR
jgi:hypothetical protein